MRVSRLIIAGLLLFSLVACDNPKEEVSGSVAKLDRKAIPVSAVVTVVRRH